MMATGVTTLNRWPRAHRRGFLLATVALAVLAVGGAGGRASAASIAPVVKIMPLGDSITMGTNVAGAYRTALEDLLVADGTRFDFVGTLNDGPPELADKDHEGHHPAFSIAHIRDGVGAWLTATNPDVILLMVGTNDFNGDDLDVAGAPARLAELLDRIERARPNTRVVLASIPPLANPSDDGQARAYNATMPAMVQARANRGFPITFVDIYSALTVADLEEGVHRVHPNVTGYAKIAAAWHKALAPFVGPAATRTYVASAATTVARDRSRVPAGQLRVQAGYRSYLRFRLPAPTGRIRSVRLRLWVMNGKGRALVYRSSTSWPRQLTWRTAPRLVGPVLARSPVGRAGGWIEIAMPVAVANSRLVTLALPAAGANAVSYSGRRGSRTPQLVVTKA
jgi:lysophospholipase L1-like esterase